MKNKTPTRRHFLKGTLLASGGLLMLNPIYGSEVTGLSTADDPDTTSFCDSRRSFFGKQIEISGRIFDATGSLPQAGISLEYWHISPGSIEKRHKGKLITDAHGYYRIKSDFPGRETGRYATFHFKVSDGARNKCACLKVTNTGAFITDKHWEDHQHLPANLLFPKWDQENAHTIEFNFSL